MVASPPWTPGASASSCMPCETSPAPSTRSPTMNAHSESAGVALKAARSVVWTALTEIVARTASPIVMVVLARILAPADFGVVATAMVAISFSQMLWDAGLNKALVQTREAPDEAANVVFWTNLLLATVTYGALFAAAPWLAAFFRSPPSGPILRVLGLQMIIAALASVQHGLCVRDLDFRRLFWIKLVTAFLPGMLSIPLALRGFGAWALVIGALSGQTLNLVLLWARSSWRPSLSYSPRQARRLLGFGVWVLAEAFGGWLILWGDSLLVGRFLGVHHLGVYRTGSMLVSVFFGLALNPFLTIAYPMLSRLQSDVPALIRGFRTVNRLVIAIAVPLALGLLATAHDMAAALLGNKWEGLDFVLGALGFATGMTWTVGLNGEAYRAIGRPDINTKFMYGQLLVFVPAYALGAHLGIKALVIAKLVVFLLTVPIHAFVFAKVTGVSRFYLWEQSHAPLLAAALMVAGILAVRAGFVGLPPGALLALSIGAGGCVYGAGVWSLDRSFLWELKAMACHALGGKAKTPATIC